MKFIKKHKRLFIILAVILILLLLLVFYVVRGVQATKKSVAKLQSDVSFIKQGQTNKSLSQVQTGLKNVQTDIDSLQGNLAYFGIAQHLPIASNYYYNAQHILNAVASIDAGAIKIAASGDPLANALGYGANPVQGQAKIAAFVKALPQLTPAIDTSITDFNNAQSELTQVNPAYLPNISIKGLNVKKDYSSYVSTFDNLVQFLPKLDSLGPVIQRALGDPLKQNYLLLLQNDKEIRATGGFITAYGYLTFDQGNLGKINTNDIYHLSPLETLQAKVPPQLAQYNAANHYYLRDANISPDVPTTAKQIEAFYNSIPESDREDIDGVVLIDTQFVASLLNAIGPVYIPEYNQHVDASNVAYWMEYYSEKVNVNATNRKQFVNLLMENIKGSVFGASGDSLIKLLQIGTQDIAQKHLMFYSNLESVENAINQYNWGGTFPSYTNGDFFGLVESNLGGAKDDFYLKRHIDTTVENTPKGVLKTVTLTYTDDQVYDGWLNEPYKAWLRFYVPQGSTFVSMSGVDSYYPPNNPQKTFRTYNDLGYSVFDTHFSMTVKLQKSDPAIVATVVLKYYLPSGFSLDGGYNEYMYMQAGMPDLPVTVEYNGKKQSADLVSDQTFSF